MRKETRPYLNASKASVFNISEQRDTCDESIAWRLMPKETKLTDNFTPKIAIPPIPS